MPIDIKKEPQTIKYTDIDDFGETITKSAEVNFTQANQKNPKHTLEINIDGQTITLEKEKGSKKGEGTTGSENISNFTDILPEILQKTKDIPTAIKSDFDSYIDKEIKNRLSNEKLSEGLNSENLNSDHLF